MVQSVRRTRSHRMKFCVQRGLGALPSTSKAEGKITAGFFPLRAECINTGIACRFLGNTKTASEETTNFTRWPILFQVSLKFSLVPLQIHDCGSTRFPASLADSLYRAASSHSVLLHLVSALA